MIYILSGIAKSGKSYISEEIVKNYKTSVFSTDYVMMMLARGNNTLDIDIHASDSSVASTIEPYIYALIKTMIENNETHVIEGVHFNTSFSLRLLEEFKDNINIVYIGYKDISVKSKVTELLDNKDHINNPWIFNHNDEPLEDITGYLIKESNRLYEECISLGLTYIEIYDIKKQAIDIIHKLLKKTS